MGRRTTTGLPFLISRPDSGQYVYFRNLAPAIAPLVTGQVTLAWRNVDHQLTSMNTAAARRSIPVHAELVRLSSSKPDTPPATRGSFPN
jgi:hypothetical protein